MALQVKDNTGLIGSVRWSDLEPAVRIIDVVHMISSEVDGQDA